MADHELTGEALREEQIVTAAVDAAPSVSVLVDGLPEPEVRDGAVGDGSAAAALGVAPAVAVARPGIKYYLPSLSGKLIVGLGLTISIVLFAIIAPWFAVDPNDTSFPGMLHPSTSHLLGTNTIGNDVFSQLATGARGSLFIGLLVGLITLVLSVIFGIVGGYLGGATDESLSLITNVMLVIPGLPLMVVIASYATQKSIWLVALVLGLTGWAASAVVLRSQTRSLRSRDYVNAARVAGEKTPRIIAVELLPNLLPLVAAQFLFSIIFAILGEAGLSYLGLGPSGTITWGTILNEAQGGSALTLGAWWWFVPPGVMIALLGCGLSLINFAIDEIINPKLRNAPAAVKKVRRAHRAADKRPSATLEAGA